MRILYHHRTQGKGVERVHIMGIVNAWRSFGLKVDIASPPGVSLDDAPQTIKTDQRRGILGVLAGKIPGVFFELLEIFYNFWAYDLLKHKLDEHDYDLAFERYAFLCIAGCLAARRKQIPFFLEVNYTSRTLIVRKRSIFIRAIERRVEKFLFGKADGLVVVSSYLKDQMTASGLDKEKILVLPNAADPDQFDPEVRADHLIQKYNLNGRKTVGFIGYFYPWHGIDLLLDTFQDVKNEVANVCYLLIGDGPTYSESYEKVIRNGLQNEILMTGRVSHETIQEYISVFDVAVMPHSNDYGSPMKILEYMAMEKAVVAPRLIPIEDIINDGMNGILFEANNRENLIQKLTELLINEELRNKISKAGRQSIEKKYNWNRNADSILKLYYKHRNIKGVNKGI